MLKAVRGAAVGAALDWGAVVDSIASADDFRCITLVDVVREQVRTILRTAVAFARPPA